MSTELLCPSRRQALTPPQSFVETNAEPLVRPRRRHGRVAGNESLERPNLPESVGSRDSGGVGGVGAFLLFRVLGLWVQRL